MTPSIDTPLVTALLDRLYTETLRVDPLERRAASELGFDDSHPQFYQALQRAHLPVTPDFGRMLYVVTRLRRARCIVEFGTSFGISTLFLAAALRDNGGGRLITTELHAEKAERAAANLKAGGLADLVEIRVGDALETLQDFPKGGVDLLFLDGAKNSYLPLLRVLGPALIPGSALLSDNVDMASAKEYVTHVKDPQNGWIRAPFFSFALDRHHGHELLLRV
ncbi:MAG: class I SAM-dependent methyltransferase [Polyangiaceae bacterium]